MLKPDYYHKEKNRNYKIGYGFGNQYFNSTKNRGIVELLINGYKVSFVPNYSFKLYPFPPIIDDLHDIRESAKDFKSMNQRRYYAFYNSTMVFFENDKNKGENFVFCSEDSQESDDDFGLIHCLDTLTFKKLTKEIRQKMPYISSERNLRHPMHHDDIFDLKFISFLDKMFDELKELLPIKFKESLEI